MDRAGRARAGSLLIVGTVRSIREPVSSHRSGEAQDPFHMAVDFRLAEVSLPLFQPMKCGRRAFVQAAVERMGVTRFRITPVI